MKRRFLIDGYNLLFSLSSFKEREKMVAKIARRFRAVGWEGLLIFDAAGREFGERNYDSPLSIVFTEQKESADDRIIEWAAFLKRQAVVVTNDLFLKKRAVSFSATVWSNAEFLDRLFSQGVFDQKPSAETPFHRDRLQKCFEKVDKKDLFP